MSKRHYTRAKCTYCSQIVSTNGLAYTSHMRRHVRDGLLIEKKDKDGYVYFIKNRPCEACGVMLSNHIGKYMICPNVVKG